MLIRSLTSANDDKLKDFVVRLLSPHFKFPINKRISVRSDINQFKWEEDSGIYMQKTGKIKQWLEIYWDDVWICDVIEGMTGAMVLGRFLRGFLDQYENNKVSLNTPTELEKAKADSIITDEINDLKKKARDKRQAFGGSPEEQMANEAVAQIIDEKVIKKEKVKNYRKLKGQL